MIIQYAYTTHLSVSIKMSNTAHPKKKFKFDPTLLKSPFFTIALANPDLPDFDTSDSDSDSPPAAERVTDADRGSTDVPPAGDKDINDSHDHLPDAPIMPEYHVHQEIISVSEELERHVNNQMREGQERRMVLHEVDSTTFGRFLEWAYTGKYDMSVIDYTLICILVKS